MSPIRASMGDPTAAWVEQALPGALAQSLAPYMAPGDRNGATLVARIDYPLSRVRAAADRACSGRPGHDQRNAPVFEGREAVVANVPLRAIASYFPMAVDQALVERALQGRVSPLRRPSPAGRRGSSVFRISLQRIDRARREAACRRSNRFGASSEEGRDGRQRHDPSGRARRPWRCRVFPVAGRNGERASPARSGFRAIRVNVEPLRAQHRRSDRGLDGAGAARRLCPGLGPHLAPGDRNGAVAGGRGSTGSISAQAAAGPGLLAPTQDTIIGSFLFGAREAASSRMCRRGRSPPITRWRSDQALVERGLSRARSRACPGVRRLGSARAWALERPQIASAGALPCSHAVTRPSERRALGRATSSGDRQ